MTYDLQPNSALTPWPVAAQYARSPSAAAVEWPVAAQYIHEPRTEAWTAALTASPRIGFRADLGHTSGLLAEVATWTNQLEAALIASLGKVTNGPRYEMMRGAPGLYFDDSRVDRMRATTFSAAMTVPNTVLLVAQLMQVNTQIMLDGGSGTTRHDFFRSGAAYPSDLNYHAGSTRTATGVLTKNHQMCAILAIFDGTVHKLYLNGTDITPVAGSPGTQSWDGINLGTSNTGASPSRMIVGELVGWDTALSAGDIATVFAYTASRYKTAGAGRNFLALGDSITVGNGSTGGGGWRALLRATTRSVQLAGYWIGSVGTIVNQQRFADDMHAGVSGDTIAAIDLRDAAAITATLPDVIYVMAGTNDCRNNGATYDSVTTPAAYQTLIESIDTADPGIPIVVTTVPPLNEASHNANVNDFNDELTRSGGVWDTLEGAGKNLVRINVHQDAFGGAYNAALFDPDGVHPNDAGYAAMEPVIRAGLATAFATT